MDTQFDNVWWLTPNFSTFGDDVDMLFTVIFVITTVTFIGVQATLMWFLWKYRRREGQKAHYTHGSHMLEVSWTLAPAIILIVLGTWSNYYWDQVKSTMPENPDYTVKVVGQQFNWNVYHAGADGEFDTDDDIHEIGPLRVPAGETVLVKLTSIDVIHSLFIPHLRVKQDAVPGSVGSLWFEVPEATPPGPDGKYGTMDDEYLEIACAELCGFGHYRMFGKLFVYPRAELDRWLAEQ